MAGAEDKPAFALVMAVAEAEHLTVVSTSPLRGRTCPPPPDKFRRRPQPLTARHVARAAPHFAADRAGPGGPHPAPAGPSPPPRPRLHPARERRRHIADRRRASPPSVPAASPVAAAVLLRARTRSRPTPARRLPAPCSTPAPSSRRNAGHREQHSASSSTAPPSPSPTPWKARTRARRWRDELRRIPSSVHKPRDAAVTPLHAFPESDRQFPRHLLPLLDFFREREHLHDQRFFLYASVVAYPASTSYPSSPCLSFALLHPASQLFSSNKSPATAWLPIAPGHPSPAGEVVGVDSTEAACCNPPRRTAASLGRRPGRAPPHPESSCVCAARSDEALLRAATGRRRLAQQRGMLQPASVEAGTAISACCNQATQSCDGGGWRRAGLGLLEPATGGTTTGVIGSIDGPRRCSKFFFGGKTTRWLLLLEPAHTFATTFF
ncbi:TANK-binding kinase 1-binding protein 1 [Triticum aestivum]|uniref:TANK-binding kinase 1-binding protein 1 n=1 Tax=Triticum aestivum TaxID=4565 RepID=UPI001D002A11|nr:TANK-binding kinase 1-binding protein 1-like [Triticum aestivum]